MSEKKKKSSKSSIGGQTQADSDDPHAEIKQSFVRFLSLRKKSIELAENIITMMNKRSFLAKERLESLTSSLMKPSSINLAMEEDFILVKESLRKTRHEVLVLLQKMNIQKTGLSKSSESSDPSNGLIDSFIDIINQVNQQTLLDEMMCDQLFSFNERGKSDQDELITILSCLKYSPFLREAELIVLGESK
jgi:hypothetical protein